MVPNPPRRRRVRRTPTPLVAFVAAVLLHVVGLGVLVGLSTLAARVAPKTPLKPKPVEIAMRPISADDWARNRGVDRREEAADDEASPEKKPPRLADSKKPEEEEKKPKPEERPKGRVVATAPGNGEEDPDAKFLAESANKVPKAVESKAKKTSPHYRNAMPQQTSPVPQKGSGSDEVKQAQKGGNGGLGEDDRPLAEQSERKLALEIPDIRAREQVQLENQEKGGPGPSVANRTESAEVRGNSKRLRLQPGSPSAQEDASQGKAGTPGIATLLPSMSVLDKVYGAAPNDHLDEVEEGAGTFLNTREWKYASYFNRIKQSVVMTWDPSAELRARDPSGRLYGGRDRQTVVQVTLDQHGRVKNVFVVKSSGLDFLDLEAVRSFERAENFPNPPPGMLNADSLLTFNFGFFLDMGGAPGPQLFR